MKRTIEVDDTLQECVDGAIDAVKDEMLSYLDQNDVDEVPDISDLDYSGAIHEIVDGAVPVYTSEIRDIFYLHGDEVEQAFDDAGIGEKKDGQVGFPMGWKAAAIYCYIENQVYVWHRDSAEDVFNEWKEKREKESDQ
jgi:hypothetical protein